jgi:hypothetical protein
MKTIELPFDVGDKVWIMVQNKPRQMTIGTIRRTWSDTGAVETTYYMTTDRSLSHPKDAVFATKEELIKHLFDL